MSYQATVLDREACCQGQDLQWVFVGTGASGEWDDEAWTVEELEPVCTRQVDSYEKRRNSVVAWPILGQSPNHSS